MANLSTMKLGKKAAAYDRRALKFSTYITPSLPMPPDDCTWAKAVENWPMHLNDQIGCCAVASHAHAIQCWTANADGVDRQVVIPDNVIKNTYFALTGGPDSGLVMLDCLKFYKSQGLNGRKIGGYVSVNFRDPEEVAQAIYTFGPAYIGIQLPLAAQSMDVWDAPRFRRRRFGMYAPGSWGGHAVAAVGYDQQGVWIVTWGELKYCTWQFVYSYFDEVFGVISEDWTNDFNQAPNGLDIAALVRDANAFGQAA